MRTLPIKDAYSYKDIVMNKEFEMQVKSKTDDELVDIFLNASDYQPEFIRWVESEIKERKIPLESLKSIKQKKHEIDDKSLEMGKQGSALWVILGFFGSIFVGIWGIVAGYQFAFSKHENSEGEELFVYNESTRKYGKWMLNIGAVVLGLTVL